MTLGELRAMMKELEDLPDDTSVLIYQQGNGYMYDLEGFGPPHEGVIEEIEDRDLGLDKSKVVVAYIS